jgi:ABC-type dipeptide/oligopeptide/nickel transport system permease component
MNEKLEKTVGLLKKLLLWFVLPLVLLVFFFILGEQFEVGRLSAIASCEGAMNTASCIRSKGYLANSPYYPDLTRRYFGAYARMIGGDLGASYRVESPVQVINLKKDTENGAEDEEADDLDEKTKKPATKNN